MTSPRVLPIALSVPHAGWLLPRRLRARCALTREQIDADGDVGAGGIYALREHVTAFVTTPLARCVLDMNRAPDDVGREDGVVKTHTCWRQPVWREPLTEGEIARLLRTHHARYHARVAAFAGRVKLAVDCHTMAAVGPPIGPDPGVLRPAVCLGHVGGASCPPEWTAALRDCFARHFAGEVTVDEPFSGGYITRTHGGAQPWVQLELARTAAPTAHAQRDLVLASLRDWCALRL